MDLHKISKIIAAIIGVLAIVLTVLCITADESDAGTMIGMFVYLAYIALLLTVGGVLFYVVLNFVNEKDKKSALIALGAFVAVILISFILADDTEYLKDGEVIASTGLSKFVSTSLNAFYITAVLAVASLVYASVGKLNK